MRLRNLRNALMACATLLALATAPAWAATLKGKVVAVDENSITVMKDGQSTVYILPSNLEIQSSEDEAITIGQLQGRTVTLTVDDAAHRQAQGEDAERRVTHIQIDDDGDVDVDTDTDTD